MSARFAEAMSKMPLVAILRGITPEESPPILLALINAGFLMIEAPLTSPQPFETIRLMRAAAPSDVLIGAGTVTTPEEVDQIAEAGGDLVVSPHCNVHLVAAAKRLGLVAIPGVATPSEAFAALGAGADALKAFPAEMITPPILRAWRAVLPAEAPILPVGGITLQSMADYAAAGAAGFGLGSSLYKPHDSVQKVAASAAAFVAAWRKLRAAKAKSLPRVQPWAPKIDAP